MAASIVDSLVPGAALMSKMSGDLKNVGAEAATTDGHLSLSLSLRSMNCQWKSMKIPKREFKKGMHFSLF